MTTSEGSLPLILTASPRVAGDGGGAAKSKSTAYIYVADLMASLQQQFASKSMRAFASLGWDSGGRFPVFADVRCCALYFILFATPAIAYL
jgi:hypothetical protein